MTSRPSSSDTLPNASRDVDFLGHGKNSEDAIEALFREIVRIEPDIDDGLDVDEESVRAEQTQEEGDYASVRVNVDERSLTLLRCPRLRTRRGGGR